MDSYGIDILWLYPDEFLDLERLKSLHYENDPYFISWKSAKQESAVMAVKKKKMNDYKARIERDRGILVT